MPPTNTRSARLPAASSGAKSMVSAILLAPARREQRGEVDGQSPNRIVRQQGQAFGELDVVAPCQGRSRLRAS